MYSLTSILILFLLSQTPEALKLKTCDDENAQFVTCGTMCEPTCEHPYIDFDCNPMCVLGCQCLPGYVLHQSKCIPIDECPGTCDDEHAEFTYCGTNCPLTCDHPVDEGCDDSCFEGCQCKQGYLLQDGKCVLPDECPNICEDENAEYTDCGTNCPSTCDQPEVDSCDGGCFEGCQCKNGYLLHDGKCVLPDECPKTCEDENAEYTDCGTNCPSTCDQPEVDSCDGGCFEGCQCKNGYLLHDGKCVLPDECPKTCEDENAEYTDCGTNCPSTCDQPEVDSCDGGCFEGCQCKNGYLLHDGKCVLPDECPKTCEDENAEYTDCGTNCPSTCDQPEVDSCDGGCFEGCQCKTGYLLQDGKCVLPDECPKTCEDENAEFNDCGSCPLTCDHPVVEECGDSCFVGCQCKKGYFLHDGKCVLRDECPENY